MSRIAKVSFAVMSLWVFGCAAAAERGHRAAPEAPKAQQAPKAQPASAPTKGAAPSDVCWKVTYGRGVGSIPTTCRAGEERNGALCYPLCRAGYYGVGPVCWQNCPEGFDDVGLFCRKGARVFAKSSYGRGVGTPPGCPAGQEKSGAICYPPCAGSYTGVGPVCWADCQGAYPAACGAFCAVSAQACVETVSEMVATGLIASAEVVLSEGSDLGALADLAKVFVRPLCATP